MGVTSEDDKRAIKKDPKKGLEVVRYWVVIGFSNPPA